MAAPVLLKAIPNQVVNEGAAYGPFNLKDYLQAPDGALLHFTAELKNGASLPKGLICTEDGLLTGIPPKGSHGNYEVVVTAQNDAGKITADFNLIIKPSLLVNEGEYFDQLKAQVWQALEQKLPIPDLGEMLERPISLLDIYYLLERWGTITMWDAFNLDPAGEKKLINLKDASPHYYVFDRGSSLVATPKDLFSHERTLEDGLQTARAMAREVFKRDWTIEMAGFNKMTRAAWVEIQHLNATYNKQLDIINYSPTPSDIRLYTSQALEKPSKPEPE